MSENLVPRCAGHTVSRESYIAHILFNFQLVGETKQVKHTEKLTFIYFILFKYFINVKSLQVVKIAIQHEPFEFQLHYDNVKSNCYP